MRDLYRPLARSGEGIDKLLGELERDIMTIMWARGDGSVRDVLDPLNAGRVDGRRLAYTTVMTVMARLADKGLLRRTRVGKAHHYEVAETREAFINRMSQNLAQRMIEDFGDAAIASFLTVLRDVPPEQLARLRRLLRSRGDA